MRHTQVLLLFICILFAYEIKAQNYDTIYFSKKYSPEESSGISYFVSYKYESDTIGYFGKRFKINIPDHLDTSELAYGYSYFTGWKEPKVNRNSVLLIHKYKDFNTEVYVDRNNNLDFTDDGKPLPLNGRNDSLTVLHLNSENTKAFFPVNIRFTKDVPEEAKKRSYEFWGDHPASKGNQYLDFKYWLIDDRYNNIVTTTALNGDTVLIGIHDYDCNGLYNNERDRFMVGNASKQSFSCRIPAGAYPYKDSSVVKIGRSNYRVISVEESGDYVVLMKTNEKPSRLVIGDRLPNFEIEMLDGTTKGIHDLLDTSKITLIDCWASWCKGCIQIKKLLVEWDSTRSHEMNIISLNRGDSKETIQRIMNEKNVQWTNAHLSTELRDTMMIDGYPVWIIIDRKGQILDFNAFRGNIDKKLQEYINGSD